MESTVTFPFSARKTCPRVWRTMIPWGLALRKAATVQRQSAS
jgi:hypothetical protein